MTAKKKLPTPKKPPSNLPSKRVTRPADYLRGGKTGGRTIGETYTAFDTYGQGKPDFGHGAGPGDPYHEVQRKVQAPVPGHENHSPPWAPGSGNATIPRKPLPWNSPGGSSSNAWLDAVRRRLQGVK